MREQYKVGDLVVIGPKAEPKAARNEVGRIVEITDHHEYPYRVEFVYMDAFSPDEISLYEDGEDNG